MTVNGLLGEWYRLPTGQVAQVREVTSGWAPEVSLRTLNNEGAMTAVEFQLSLAFLLLHAAHVDVQKPAVSA